MKKLYYSLIVLLVVFVGLVMPKTKAAGEFDDNASYIGVIDVYAYDDNGYIIGAWVDIVESTLPTGDYPAYWFFEPQYFQPDILVLGDELRQANVRFIWNPFDDRVSGDDYSGAWWLLIGYEYISDDIADAYEYGYESGYNNGYVDGERAGYDNGFDVGFGDGFDVGYEEGELQGYNDGYNNGYDDGHNDGREQVLNSIESMEILYQDVVLPNGVKDEIVNNEILVDRVGVAVFDGSENWKRYNFDVEPYTTVAFYLAADYAKYDSNRNHYISNMMNNGSVMYNDIANRMDFTGSSVAVRLLKSDLVPYGYDDGMTDQQKANVFKSWLAAQKEAGEPLTVWYQYAEPEQYDLISLLRNEDGSFKDGYNVGYEKGRVDVQKENKSLLSVIPTTIGSIWLMVSDFLSFEVFGINLWAIIIVFASFSLLVLIIKMVI